MKLIHRDPALHAQRVAAIKKAKGTAAARERTSEALKSFFSDPENRRKRSIAMKGIRYICKHCGQGHRSYYCPQLKEKTDRRFKCGLCGRKGHNRATCQKPITRKPKERILREYHCRSCGKIGHNRRTCPLKTELHSNNSSLDRRGSLMNSESEGYIRKYFYQCGVCGEFGHNRRTCSQNPVREPYHCRVCGNVGHNSRTCPLNTERQSHNAATEYRGSLEDSEELVQKHHHQCSICGIVGHNKRTCDRRNVEEPAFNPVASHRVKERRHCRICGVIGHNRRTCPNREPKAV